MLKYEALLAGLGLAKALKALPFHDYNNSQLIVN